MILFMMVINGGLGGLGIVLFVEDGVGLVFVLNVMICNIVMIGMGVGNVVLGVFGLV